MYVGLAGLMLCLEMESHLRSEVSEFLIRTKYKQYCVFNRLDSWIWRLCGAFYKVC